MEEKLTIVTMRVEDEKFPAPGSKKGFVCNDCGEPVWICDTSLPHMNAKTDICCNRCIGFRMLREEHPMDEWEMRAADPEFEQLFQENKEEIVGWIIKRSLKDSDNS